MRHVRFGVENVRCFRDVSEIPIRPITILVGENSSGKSAFMSALHIASQSKFPFTVDFNPEPYHLGNFSSIASRFPSDGTADEFSIKYDTDDKSGDEWIKAKATFASRNGQPALKSYKIETEKKEDNLKEVRFLTDLSSAQPEGVEFSEDRSLVTIPIPEELRGFSKASVTEYLLNVVDLSINPSINSENSPPEEDSPPTKDDIDKEKAIEFIKTLRNVASLWSNADSPLDHLHSIAPVRSKPRRTYDFESEAYSPSGAHAPYVLARELKKKDDAQSLRRELHRFGKEAGLFEEIGINSLGEEEGSPFQITASSNGETFNIVDVGYGVSQSLPIIIESVAGEECDTLLMQQPEVHLHPRAQAALGTFMAQVSSNLDKTFVFETHSDYIVDRIRYEISSEDTEIDSSDVALLWFEQEEAGTSIVHEVELSDDGRPLDPPDGYRSFFLRENIKMMSG